MTTKTAFAMTASVISLALILEVRSASADALAPSMLCQDPVLSEEVSRSAALGEFWDVAAWEVEFQDSMASEHATNLSFAQSANSFQHYQLSYAIDGFAAMAEATSKADYADNAFLYVNEVMKTAVPSSDLPESRYQDGFMGWGAFDHPIDPRIAGNEYPLFESYFWRYVARLLRVVRDHGFAEADPVLQTAYDRTLAFLETHVFDKWRARGSSNIYRNRTHMASHWAYIALEIGLLTEDETRRKQASAIVERINQALRDNMIDHPEVAGGYFWDHHWNSTSPPGQDVPHGNGVVSYLIEAAELDVGWTFEDLKALSLTFEKVIWRIDGGEMRYAAFVDGSGKGTGWFNDGFIKLGRISPDIQARLEDHPVGRNIQFFGNAALNARRMDIACE